MTCAFPKKHRNSLIFRTNFKLQITRVDIGEMMNSDED